MESTLFKKFIQVYQTSGIIFKDLTPGNDKLDLGSHPQVGGTDRGISQQLFAGAFTCDPSGFHDICAACECEGMPGILLHQQDGKATLINFGNRLEKFSHDDGR